MLIRDSEWNKIREQFSDEEKSELRKADIGESICPRGTIIEATKLPLALRMKVAAAVGELRMPSKGSR